MAEYATCPYCHNPLSQDEWVKVVRCRDCKHYKEHEWILVTDVSDVCHFFGDGVKVEPDGYCAWGVRREDA